MSVNGSYLASLSMKELDELEGRSIRLICMPDDPNPVPPGTTGKIVAISEFPNEEFQVVVDWDINRSINICCSPDTFEVID